MAEKSIITDLNSLAVLFGLPTIEEIDEANIEYYSQARHEAIDHALKDSRRIYGRDYELPDDVVDEIGDEAEMEAQDEVYGSWSNAVMEVADYAIEEMGMESRKPGEADPWLIEIYPRNSWEEVAENISDLLAASRSFYLGTEEFIDEFGDGDPRKAVAAGIFDFLDEYFDVYGVPSPERIFDASFNQG